MPSHRPGARTPQQPVGYYLRREGRPDLPVPVVLNPTAVGAGLVVCASAGLLTVVLTGQQQGSGPSPGDDGLATGTAEPSRPPLIGPTRAPGTAAAPQAPATVLAIPVGSPASRDAPTPGDLTGGRVPVPPGPWRPPTVVAAPPLAAPPPTGSPQGGSPVPAGARPEGSGSASSAAEDRILAAPPTPGEDAGERQTAAEESGTGNARARESSGQDSDGEQSGGANAGSRQSPSRVFSSDEESSRDEDSDSDQVKGARSKKQESTGRHTKGKHAEGKDSEDSEDSEDKDSEDKDSKDEDAKGKHSKDKDSKDKHSKDKDSEGKHAKDKDSKGKHAHGRHSEDNDSKDDDSKDEDSESKHAADKDSDEESSDKHAKGNEHQRGDDTDADRAESAGKHSRDRSSSGTHAALLAAADNGKRTAERVLTFSWAAISRPVQPVLSVAPVLG